jgi:diadenosine tetraphosphate (Ap4A) HIT family hydrolase
VSECALCQPSDADGVCSSEHWRVIVNHNQNRLGKCMICLKRHDEDICNLSDEEVRDLWAIIRELKVALGSCFQPDHFNYAFLMNQDAHIHLHVIPRYRGIRTLAGIKFQDSDATTQRTLPERVQRQIASALRDALRINPR